jgi:dephospho-CoA kinase
LTLGLTGGYCAGKNAVAALLEARGFTCFDVDKLGHEAMGLEESMEAIAWRFGPSVLNPDGTVDRRALGAIVFDDPEGLADLEAIIHPAVYRLLRPRLKAELDEGHDVCINAALLYRMTDTALCEAIIEVRAPLLLRVSRGMARDGLSAPAVLLRIRKQKDFWKRRKESGKPIILVRNAGSMAALEARIDRVLACLH